MKYIKKITAYLFSGSVPHDHLVSWVYQILNDSSPHYTQTKEAKFQTGGCNLFVLQVLADGSNINGAIILRFERNIFLFFLMLYVMLPNANNKS